MPRALGRVGASRRSWISEDPAAPRRIAASEGRSSTFAAPNGGPPGSCSVGPTRGKYGVDTIDWRPRQGR